MVTYVVGHTSLYTLAALGLVACLSAVGIGFCCMLGPRFCETADSGEEESDNDEVALTIDHATPRSILKTPRRYNYNAFVPAAAQPILSEPLTVIRRVLGAPFSAFSKGVAMPMQYASVPAVAHSFGPPAYTKPSPLSPRLVDRRAFVDPSPLSPRVVDGRAHFVVNAASSPPRSSSSDRVGQFSSSNRPANGCAVNVNSRDLPAVDSEARHALQVKATLLPMRRM